MAGGEDNRVGRRGRRPARPPERGVRKPAERPVETPPSRPRPSEVDPKGTDPADHWEHGTGPSSPDVAPPPSAPAARAPSTHVALPALVSEQTLKPSARRELPRFQTTAADFKRWLGERGQLGLIQPFRRAGSRVSPTAAAVDHIDRQAALRELAALEADVVARYGRPRPPLSVTWGELQKAGGLSDRDVRALRQWVERSGHAGRLVSYAVHDEKGWSTQPCMPTAMYGLLLERAAHERRVEMHGWFQATRLSPDPARVERAFEHLMRAGVLSERMRGMQEDTSGASARAYHRDAIPFLLQALGLPLGDLGPRLVGAPGLDRTGQLVVRSVQQLQQDGPVGQYSFHPAEEAARRLGISVEKLFDEVRELSAKVVGGFVHILPPATEDGPPTVLYSTGLAHVRAPTPQRTDNVTEALGFKVKLEGLAALRAARNVRSFYRRGPVSIGSVRSAVGPPLEDAVEAFFRAQHSGLDLAAIPRPVAIDLFNRFTQTHTMPEGWGMPVESYRPGFRTGLALGPLADRFAESNPFEVWRQPDGSVGWIRTGNDKDFRQYVRTRPDQAT